LQCPFHAHLEATETGSNIIYIIYIKKEREQGMIITELDYAVNI